MSQPLLCTIADVKARTTVTISDPALTDLVTAVSDEIEDYVGAWLAPRNATTLLFDVERAGSSLRLQIASRRVGIRTLTSIGVASSDQPESGGSYTTVPLTSVLLRPRPTDDGLATSLVFVSPYALVRGYNTVTATGDFGPAAVLPRVKEVAIELTLFRLGNGQNVSSESVGDWSVAYANSAKREILAPLGSLSVVAV